MPQKRRATKFFGTLAEPIYDPPAGGILAFPEEGEARRARLFGLWKQKLDVLCDHYEVDRAASNRWELLSFCLAFDFVPGMWVKGGQKPVRGRRRSWKAGLAEELWEDVARVMKWQGCTIRDAIKHLKKTDPKWHHHSVQNMETRLRETRRESRHRLRLAEALGGGYTPLWQLAEQYRAATQNVGAGLYGGGAIAAQGDEIKSGEN